MAQTTEAAGPECQRVQPAIAAPLHRRGDFLDDFRSNPPPAGLMILLPRLAKQVLRRSGPDQIGMHLRLIIALSYLRDHDGAPQQHLADVLAMDANNVVLLLNELESAGHITRRRDPADRRRHLVELTDAGRRALLHAEHAERAIEDEVLRALTIEERETLRNLLRRAVRDAEPSLAEDGQTHTAHKTG
jgi:DNA-binding MarR family transcriptional regulator